MPALLEAASAVDLLADPHAARRQQRPHATATDISLDGLRLNGQKLDLEIAAAITEGGGQLERTIEGASTLTLTLHDPEHDLVNSGILLPKKGVVLVPGGSANKRGAKRPIMGNPVVSIPHPRGRKVQFALAKVSKREQGYELVFEDAEVAVLRAFWGALKAYRDRITRAEFVFYLVREARKAGWDIKTNIPELHKKQPQASAPVTKTTSKKKTGDDRSAGFGPNENLKIKGVRATPWQLRQAEIAADVGTELNAPELAMLAMFCSGIGESGFRQLVNSLGYGGVFQGQVETGGRFFSKEDTEAQARCFFLGGKGFQAGGAIHLAKTQPKLTPGSIATMVEASGEPPSFYDAFRGEAEALLRAYGGGGGSRTSTVTKRTIQRFKYLRGRNETSWDAIQRLAEDVQWRAFMVEGTLFYISEDDLFRSRPRMRISEASPGVDWIDWEWDTGKAVAEASVRCRAGLWSADPGTVVVIEGEGPAVDGRWLVTQVSRGLFDPTCEITLKQPMKPKLEPAPEESGGGDKSDRKRGGRNADDGSTARLIEECRKFKGPYDYGGGHGPPVKELSPSQGLDCSSSTALALYKAGLFHGETAPVSGWFASSYGEPGKGKEFTVWANSGHVFIDFAKGGRFDTGGPGGGNGPRLRPENRPTGGFTPRHYPGL